MLRLLNQVLHSMEITARFDPVQNMLAMECKMQVPCKKKVVVTYSVYRTTNMLNKVFVCVSAYIFERERGGERGREGERF